MLLFPPLGGLKATFFLSAVGASYSLISSTQRWALAAQSLGPPLPSSRGLYRAPVPLRAAAVSVGVGWTLLPPAGRPHGDRSLPCWGRVGASRGLCSRADAALG